MNFYGEATQSSNDNRIYNEQGIILTSELCNVATSKEKNDFSFREKYWNEVGNNFQNVICKGKNISEYHSTTELSFSYCHDDKNAEGSTLQFLNIYNLYMNKNKNHDVMAVGKNLNAKLEALRQVKDQIIQNGYGKIVFVNMDTNKEEVLHDDNSPNQKVFRMVYKAALPHRHMIAMQALSGDLCNVTGDQSLGEALSAGKLIVYECFEHKKEFHNNLNMAINNAVQDEFDKSFIKESQQILRQFRVLNEELSKAKDSKQKLKIQKQIDDLNVIYQKRMNMPTTLSGKVLELAGILRNIDLNNSSDYQKQQLSRLKVLLSDEKVLARYKQAYKQMQTSHNLVHNVVMTMKNNLQKQLTSTISPAQFEYYKEQAKKMTVMNQIIDIPNRPFAIYKKNNEEFYLIDKNLRVLGYPQNVPIYLGFQCNNQGIISKDIKPIELSGNIVRSQNTGYIVAPVQENNLIALDKLDDIGQKISAIQELMTQLHNLHDKKIYCPNITMKNILFDPATKKVMIITPKDNRLLENNNIASTDKFDLKRMAPELLSNKNYGDPRTDMYQYAFLIAELMGIKGEELYADRLNKALVHIKDPEIAKLIRRQVIANDKIDDLEVRLPCSLVDSEGFKAFKREFTQSNQINLKSLEKQLGQKATAELQKLLESMTSPDISKRPTSLQVLSIIGKIDSKYLQKIHVNEQKSEQKNSEVRPSFRH